MSGEFSVGFIPTYLGTGSIQLTGDHPRHYIIRNKPCICSASAFLAPLRFGWKNIPPLATIASAARPTSVLHRHKLHIFATYVQDYVPFCDMRPQQIPRTQLCDVVFLSHTRAEGALPRTRLPEEEHAKWACLCSRRSRGRRRRRRLWCRTRKPRHGGLGRARDSTAVCFRDRSVEVQLQAMCRSTKLTSRGLHFQVGRLRRVSLGFGECGGEEEEVTGDY